MKKLINNPLSKSLVIRLEALARLENPLCNNTSEGQQKLLALAQQEGYVPTGTASQKQQVCEAILYLNTFLPLRLRIVESPEAFIVATPAFLPCSVFSSPTFLPPVELACWK